MSEQTFSQQVEQAAKEAGITPDVETQVMTPEEEAIPAEEYKPAIDLKAEVAKEERAREPDQGQAVVAQPETVKEEAKPEPPQTVPLAVHIRQREKFEREQAELRRAMELGNERLRQLAEAITPKPQPVDRNTDPFGATLEELDSLKQSVAETKDMLARREQEEANRRQINSFQQAVISDEQTFQQQNEDYPQAVQFAKDMKFREYVALGLDPHQASARVQQDAFALAQHALQRGESPAEMAYRMAAAIGYRKEATTQQPANAAPPKTQAETAIEMRAAGAQRGKSTGGAPANSGPMSFAELAALDNEEFAKMTSGKKWQRLFGSA